MRIGLIGGGKLAEALISGILASHVAEPDSIAVCDIDPSRRSLLEERFGVKTTESHSEVIRASDVIILALKPNVMPEVLPVLDREIASKLVISVAAGTPIERIEASLPRGTRVVRVMPNLNCAVRKSCTAVSPGTNAREADLETAERIFGSVGITLRMGEEKLDAVTALSGSGPAYAFIFIEALSDAGVLCGLSREDSIKMAAQTVLGAAKMVLESQAHPAQLKDRVCSPGGTTIAAVSQLERSGFRGAVISAVEAAFRRSKQLAG